ncbi:hypothetical protein [Caldinitratiruptor microaerophilus]|uniref:Uncharacterized protein n=1 Tax=Caldinitratiruptor microaerophilus TaxID=671077 RepID=A0AA35CI03_9FIRM|nr:hypothetical protein [Caldinitratiruptor microaerophilus]BDG59282.1 hypothetical protein caldi_03720 [Caldinitratiruptor microaerophilus]
MTRTRRVILGIVGAATLGAGVFFLTPYGRAVAASTNSWTAVHNRHMAQAGADMTAMHAAMTSLAGEMPAIHERMTAALAEKLGITPAELRQALGAGQTLAQLAQEKGVEPQALRAAMIGEMQRILTDLVQAGKLDAQTAARMRGLIEAHSADCLTTDMSGMHGSGGTAGMAGMAGMMGPF